ncbi:hypothetical protein OQA88_11624 [Cercophora sp. LCS_1]
MDRIRNRIREQRAGAKDGAPEETNYQPVNWKRVFLRPKYLVWWVILIVVIVLTVLITIHHDQVVKYLEPFAKHVRDLRAGWLIPIAILIVISFPPLFGHELVALLCGVVYVGTWFAFQYLLRAKAQKLERTNLNYGALARLTRDGGFWIVLVIRFSAIPSHFATAVFSTCGVNFWFFAIATFLTLPKQIFLVYLGVLLVQEKPSHGPKNIVFGIAFVITIIMGVYIWWKMRAVKKVLLEEQAERRSSRLVVALEPRGANKDDDPENPFRGEPGDEVDTGYAGAGAGAGEMDRYGAARLGGYEALSRQEEGIIKDPWKAEGYQELDIVQAEERGRRMERGDGRWV